jgi:hypothetical protein
VVSLPSFFSADQPAKSPSGLPDTLRVFNSLSVTSAGTVAPRTLAF